MIADSYYLFITLSTFCQEGKVQSPFNASWQITPFHEIVKGASTSDAPELSDTDFGGNPRILGPTPHIGVDEFIKLMLWLHLLLGD